MGSIVNCCNRNGKVLILIFDKYLVEFRKQATVKVESINSDDELPREMTFNQDKIKIEGETQIALNEPDITWENVKNENQAPKVDQFVDISTNNVYKHKVNFHP